MKLLNGARARLAAGLLCCAAPGLAGAQIKSKQSVAKPQVLDAAAVDAAPQFPGGAAALSRYLVDSLHYPDAAYQQRISGQLTVHFVVEADGRLQDFRAEPLGGGCQQEALRLVQAMPRWTPATRGGQSVATRTAVIVEFLSDFKRWPRPGHFHPQPPRRAVQALGGGRESLQATATTGTVQPPTFFGEVAGEDTYFDRMPTYVPYAKERNISGLVQLEFMVQTDGRVSQLRVLRTLCPACDAEVLRVARAQPLWYPGTRFDKPVAMPVVMNVPYEPNYGSRQGLPAAFGQHLPEVPAVFPGGVAALAKALHTQPVPEEAPGILDSRPPFWVTFTVETDGRLTTIKSLDQPENTLTDEARLVVAALPRWQPARRKGIVVASAQVLGVPHAAVAYYERNRAAKAAQAGIPVQFPKDTRVYEYTELMPRFVNGPNELLQYLQQQTKLPAEVLQGKVEGRVFVQMIIQPDGSLKEVKVQKGLSAACDTEALRVVKAMPRWTPGQQNGQKVAVRYMLPVPFARPAEAGK